MRMTANPIFFFLTLTPLTTREDIKVIEKCIAEVHIWMISYRLSINDKKTEYFIIASYKQRFHWVNCWRYLCVRNLGVFIDIWFSKRALMLSKFVVKLSVAYIPSGIQESFLLKNQLSLWFTPLSLRILTIAILFYMACLKISATVYRGSLMLLLGWFVLSRSLTMSILL